MDCYMRNSSDNIVFQKNQPSTESWPNWGTLESFEFPDNCFVTDSNLFAAGDLQLYGDSLCNKDEISSSNCCMNRSSDSSVGGGSLDQTAPFCHWPDHQLDYPAEMEQIDEIFLNTCFEDLPGHENTENAFCFTSESDSGVSPADNHPIQELGDGTPSEGSSKHLKKDALNSPAGWETNDAPSLQLNPCKTEQAHLDRVIVSLDCKSANLYKAAETSLEAMVLQEIEMLTAQLTDKTRICFRDALYRLAKNSKNHATIENLNGDRSIENLSWTFQDGKMSPKRKGTTESETNTIDRAIASLMFNRMESNVHHCETAVPNYSVGQSRTYSLSHCPIILDDAEVPIYHQGYP